MLKFLLQHLGEYVYVCDSEPVITYSFHCMLLWLLLSQVSILEQDVSMDALQSNPDICYMPHMSQTFVAVDYK